MHDIDWIVVGLACALCLGVGLVYTRRAARAGEEGYFTAGRSLSWWAVGISNSATYQSGLGAFVMLIFVFGLSGNWLWWIQWIIWMPLVAVIWARMWRRMRIVTTAELISLRYGGRPAAAARKVYAAAMSCFAVIIIAYITGFFAKTVAPLVPLSEGEILLIFGSITALYTMFGGLMGSVMAAVAQMILMMGGSMVFLLIIVPKFGGWGRILETVEAHRQGGLTVLPDMETIPAMSVAMFVILGLFFAGSPTAGEGMTAQRFMAAKNERHAMGGQLFNAFIALSLRVIPLVGLGIVSMALFWHPDLVARWGPAPEGFTTLRDRAYAWGELVKAGNLPPGFAGLLVATEAAAFMSTLSALINWGSSFLVNDLYKACRPGAGRGEEILASRAASLLLFAVAAAAAMLFVKDMVSWFLFINSVVVIFWLPLAYFRFFWFRFNVWGELAATVLGLPLSILVWFVLGYDEAEFWKGSGILFATALAVLTAVTLATPPESRAVLMRFYERCRPPAGWKAIRAASPLPPSTDPTLGHMIFDSLLGILACLGLVTATNAVFVGNIPACVLGSLGAVGCGAWMLGRLSGLSTRSRFNSP